MDRKLVQKLIDLAVDDQPAAARLLREQPALLNARYIHGETPLHFCAVEGFVEGVRFLAEAGVPVDAVNEFGDSALVDAATLGNLEVVKVLLSHGANPNAGSDTRGPVLHIAADRGHVEMVAALLDAEARSDYVTFLGERIWDITWRREGVAKLLESRGIKP